uniref:MHD domain-containing protein n=1 Tax=Picocystis salinarum TaxID=88271 RepID=A0A7S3UG12_9CHLO|mmetsp:Transcript_10558/g.64905  ORF Transcript_10558/g.64905 Transcript_10558/m.64905 type:complete len:596 (+) Transcript_10558:94-1881(+)|eukprot:CAMPEP_0183830662 /NCGR_PEP_ID=MMETSP0807_2-20130328/4151_1 /TAXON_ID=88271 /ORGANISM="Picocystis salinarum, Strain CCMP1897" /LENGTH=595 /DNA_ID=CAMNT_0026076043 /DNA_START=27 /DNA_END=1814 /DNA_ORIENTATION=+
MEPFPAGVAVHERRGKPLLLQAREIPLAKLSETATEVAHNLDRRATMPAGSVQTNGDIAWSREEGEEMFGELEVLYKRIPESFLMVVFPRGENVFMAQELMDNVLAVLFKVCGEHLNPAAMVAKSAELVFALDELLASSAPLQERTVPQRELRELNMEHSRRRNELLRFSMVVHPSELQAPTGVDLHVPASCKKLAVTQVGIADPDALEYYGEADAMPQPPSMNQYAVYKDEDYEEGSDGVEIDDEEGEILFDDDFGNAFDDEEEERDEIELLPQYADESMNEGMDDLGKQEWESFDGTSPAFNGHYDANVPAGGFPMGRMNFKPRPEPCFLILQEHWKLNKDGRKSTACSLVGKVLRCIRGTRGMQEPIHFTVSTPSHLQLKNIAANPRIFTLQNSMDTGKTFTTVLSENQKMNILQSHAQVLGIKYSLNPSLCIQPLQVHATAHFFSGNGLSLATRVLLAIDFKSSSALSHPLRDIVFALKVPEAFALPPNKTSCLAQVSSTERKIKWQTLFLDPGCMDTLLVEFYAAQGTSDSHVLEDLSSMACRATFRHTGGSFSGISLTMEKELDWVTLVPAEGSGEMTFTPQIRKHIAI